jgi:DNA-binding transcriptional MerR regulator
MTDIPKRALYKPAEVCQIAQVQPYVLRSWEAEFPDLGTAAPGGGRVYRRGDLDRVLQIKQLVFGEGLTLAGARKRVADEGPVHGDPVGNITALLDADARDRIAEVRRGLKSLLELIDGNGKATAAPTRFATSKPSRPANGAAHAAPKRAAAQKQKKGPTFRSRASARRPSSRTSARRT